MRNLITRTEKNSIKLMIALNFMLRYELLILMLYTSTLGGDSEWRNSRSEREPCTIKKSKTGTLHPTLESFLTELASV